MSDNPLFSTGAALSEEEKKLKREKTYDLTLTTMIESLPELIIPFINDIFDEHFTDQAIINRLNTKHVIRHLDGSYSKREADVFIKLTEAILIKYYHFELETWFDGKLIIRIAEYGSNFAFENAVYSNNSVVLEYPNSVAIFLRPDDKIPKSMSITHRGPNGEEMTYEVPVVQIRDYTVETIFEKKLFMLLPFYLFKFANRFSEIDKDENRIKKIKLKLEEIDRRLTDLRDTDEIGAYQKRELLELMQRVSASLTQDYKNIRKGVDDVMSVAIIRTQADEILEQGKKETTVSHIKNVMKSLQCGVDKAMDVIMIPQDQRTMYAELVNG